MDYCARPLAVVLCLTLRYIKGVYAQPPAASSHQSQYPTNDSAARRWRSTRQKVFAIPPAIITTRHPFTGWPITQPINLNRTDVPLGSHGPFLLLLEPECIGYRGNFVGICCTCMSDWSVCLFYI